MILFLILGTKSAFSQEIHKHELFKGANLIVLETSDPTTTLKEAGKYLVSNGYTIEKYDKDLGQIVTSSKECSQYRTWECRYVLSKGKKSLEWKTEAISSIDLAKNGPKEHAKWVLATYKKDFKSVMEQSKEDALLFASSSVVGAIWFTVRD